MPGIRRKTNTLYLFAASITAVRQEEDENRILYHGASYVYAKDKESAYELIYSDAIKDHPEEDGYYKHTVSIIKVPGVTMEVPDGTKTDA